MIILLALILGAAIGVYSAKRKGGDAKDMAQYGAVYAIIFALIALFTTILLARLLTV